MKLILALILFLHSTTSAATFFVKPTYSENASCPGQPCHTLDQYAQNSSACFTTGSTFVFLSGHHSLQNTVSLFAVSNLTFTKWENDSSAVNIFCKSKVAILCNATGNFTIQGLTFSLILDDPIQNSSYVTLIDSRDIMITNSTFQGSGHLTESFTFCQALVSVRSNIDIKDCFFRGNMGYNGGAIYAEETAIKLTGNIFMGNKVTNYGGALYASGGSLNIHQGNSFIQNSADIGGAISCKSNCTLNVTGNEMLNETEIVFIANNASSGSAIYLDYSALFLSGRSRIEFIGNVATHSGAGIYMIHSTMISYAENLYFTGNTVPSFGGAIYASIESSVVLGGENMSKSYFYTNSAGYGGAISVKQSLTLGEGTHYFFNNTAARFGGAIYFGNIKAPSGRRNNITIKGNSIFKNNCAKETGGAIWIHFSDFLLAGTMLLSNNEGYYGGGMCILYSSIVFKGNVTLRENLALIGSDANHVTFTETIVRSQLGGGIYSWNSSLLFEGPSYFYGNKASRGGAIFTFYGTILFECNTTAHQFSHNRAKLYGGAIYADQTAISILHGAINFTFNSAQNGGAMYFYSSVTFAAASFTHLYSSNNSASHYGGSIYYDDSSVTSLQCIFQTNGSEVKVELLPFCFFQFTENDIVFYSDGDYAGKDGSFLYGGLLDRCKMKRLKYYNHNELIIPYNFLWSQVFNLSVQDNETRNVTSKPYQLCFCSDDQTRNCFGQKFITVYRGQTFNLSILALDQMKNIIPTLVTARVGETATLGFNQNLQTSTEHCTNLTFSFYSTKNESELLLYLDSPCRDTGLAQAVVSVTFLPCPDGFVQSREKCTCEERLIRYRAMCNIEETVYITRETGSRFWMGALYSIDRHYEGLVLYETCPFDYCKQDSINLTLQSLDKQCNVNRGKVLCGACVNNSSLMLGGFQCGVCSNRYLTLIIVFAVAGIVLVIFLSFLRLTVATGMINGVILYANIVQVNRTIFFPDNPHNVLTVFIAWLNLDLGFQTCFYDGVDAYTQTWLQFVFPLYVWILIALIIFSSRYSITVSKLIGSNPIAVLATLLLMSYTKVLKIIIEVYSYVDLDYPDNSIVRVWLKDANAPYLKSRHLLLTLVSTAILVLLFIPYTFLLLFGYKLYCYSNKKYLNWLMKTKPLLDSYYAPYKIHTRYWTGLLLIVRCGLYAVFSFNSLGGTTKSLVVITIAFVVVILALSSIRIYSSFFLNILEALVYLNLVVLSASSLAGFNTPPLVHTMVGAVFVTMMCVIVYHLHLAYVRESTLWLKVKAKTVELIRKNSDKQEDAPLPMEVSKTVVDLREPLLDNV